MHNGPTNEKKEGPWSIHYGCLIVDDEAVIAESTSEYLNLFEVNSAYVTGYEECLVFLENNTVSMILLDINLGEQSGFTLCKKLREITDVPILLISTKTSDDDILTALNIGGDDYIKKPYTLSIPLAKVKAVLKRYVATDSPKTVTLYHIKIDLNSHKVASDKVPVKLRELEFKFLVYLAKNRNRVITKEELFQNVRPDPYVGEGTLTVHICHLREKLERDSNHLEMILTVWGAEYRTE